MYPKVYGIRLNIICDKDVSLDLKYESGNLITRE